jgi:hypothetical protein
VSVAPARVYFPRAENLSPIATSRPGGITVLLVGFFGGTAHALPSFFYMGGAIGPFDLLVLLLLMRWLLFSRLRIEWETLRLWAPFYLLALFGYIGELSGALAFNGTSWSGVLAPFRYLYYPTLFITLRPLLQGAGRLRLLFSAYVAGVLAICVQNWIRSPDPSFFFGLPVLYDPNVVGNFIGYAFISLGFAFMPRRLLFKGSAIAALFAFALFTFSKASWLLAIAGTYVNTITVSKWRLVLGLASLAGLSLAFVDWGHIFLLVSDAIDIKLASSVGQDGSGGTATMRLGFFIASMWSLVDYPLGIGLKNFTFLNERYVHELGSYFAETESPHTAVGFVAVQAGWVGMLLLVLICHNVYRAMRELYGAPRLGIRLTLIGMMLVSIFFQIEFLTQPFIYLVLAASLARRHSLAAVGNGLPVVITKIHAGS